MSTSTKVSKRRHQGWERRARRTKRIVALLLQPDAETRYFDRSARRALHSAVHFALETEAELARYRGTDSWRIRRDVALESTVHTLAAIGDQDAVMTLGRLLPGVRVKTRSASSVSRLVREHKSLVTELESVSTGAERRLSALLDLICIEHLLLGYWEGTGWRQRV